MELLTGEFNNTLDEKGRVSIPSRLREQLPGNTLIVTKGIERCVWLLPPEQWEKVSITLLKITSLSMKKSNLILHRFIVPAQEVEIDRTGRIAVPQSLREFAGLTKNCAILGKGKSIEIWDTERYQTFLEDNEELVKNIMEETEPFILF